MKRAAHLTWEESASYTLTLATAYRMLFGHRPHILRPGHNVLVWGAAGGIGSMAVQLIATAGAHAIGVISDPSKTDFVMQLGAKGVVNRNDLDCWGPLPDVHDQKGYSQYKKKEREFAAAISEITGQGRIDPCMSEVFEWADIPKAHTKMWKNQHKPGNMAVLVSAKRPGLRTLEDALEG